jgi:hypothetical protein
MFFELTQYDIYSIKIFRCFVNLNAFIFHGLAKPEDFETSIRELKDSYRPTLQSINMK